MSWKHQLGPLQNEEADGSRQARMLDRAARLLEWSIALLGGVIQLRGGFFLISWCGNAPFRTGYALAHAPAIEDITITSDGQELEALTQDLSLGIVYLDG